MMEMWRLCRKGKTNVSDGERSLDNEDLTQKVDQVFRQSEVATSFKVISLYYFYCKLHCKKISASGG